MVDSSSRNNTVDTYGWHTVAAITYADVNKAIATSKSGPSSFSQTAPDNSCSVTGTFGPWSLTTGGSGSLIKMSVPITNGSVALGAQITPISACTATIELQATYVPQPGGGPSVVNLVPNNQAPVTVIDCQPPAQSFMVQAALINLLGIWLSSHLQEFNVVFSSVDLDAKYENDGAAWLKPSAKGYAVAEPAAGATLNNSVFAVLCLIDGTAESSDLAFQVSPYAIPANARAAFLISPQKFLEHMMLAATPYMFDGIADDPPTQHFAISNEGTAITNTTDLTLSPVSLENGRVVSPTVPSGNFSIQVQATQLVINVSDMQFSFAPGITVHLDYQASSTVSLDTRNMILALNPTQQSGGCNVVVSEALQIEEVVTNIAAIALSVVSGLGGLVGKALTTAKAVATAETVGSDAVQVEAQVSKCCGLIISKAPAQLTQLGARFIGVAKIAGLGAFFATAESAIPRLIEIAAQGDYQSMPKITQLTSAAVGRTVMWPGEGVGTFQLGSCQLNNALQFGLT